MKSSIESSFSKSANTYDQNSDVQKQIADHLVSMIELTTAPKTVIDLGSGTGYLACKLLEKFQNSCIDLCDISAEMLEVSSKKVKFENLICANFEELNVNKKYDLVASSAALHWSESFEKICEVLASLSESHIAISLMLDGTLNELRTIRKEVAPNKTVKPILKVFDYYLNILNKKFTVLDSNIQTYTLYFPTAELALDSLRKTGVNGGSSEKLSKDEYLKLIELYSQRYKANEGYQLTYRAGFILSRIS